MQFNSILFPAPVASYNQHNLDGLIWIPRSKFFSNKSQSQLSGNFETNYGSSVQNFTKIPCHFERYKDDCRNTIIYFHANAEDLGLAQSFIRRIALGLETNVLSVEYPGYGIYAGKPCVQTIIEDSEFVFDFLVGEIGLKPEEIIILGRSIGSGPAIHVASQRNPKALLLVSPFTSIQDVVKDFYGHKVSFMVADKFRNLEKIANVKCSCYFIHGQKDTLILPDHSKKLISNCKAKSQLHSPEEMTHNDFRVYADIIEPIKLYLDEQDYKVIDGKIEFPDYSTLISSQVVKQKKKLMTKIVIAVGKHNKY